MNARAGQSGPQMAIVRQERAGRNLRLYLQCGHSVLHTPAVKVPTKKHCRECEPIGSTE